MLKGLSCKYFSLGFGIISLYMCAFPPYETSYLSFFFPEVLWALDGKKLPELFIKKKKKSQCILGNVLQLDLILVICFNYLFIKMLLHL